MSVSISTKFGREKEPWEYDVAAFCERGKIPANSPMGKALYRLSQDEFEQLTAMCDPASDGLLHVGQDGLIIGHANIGNRGIYYDFL